MHASSTTATSCAQPLHAYEILRTHDLDEACSRVAGVFSPHELRVARQDQWLDARMCHAPIGGVSVNRLCYGASVKLDIGRTKDFLLVMMPLSGGSNVHCGDTEVRTGPGRAAVVSPTLPLRMDSSSDADQIMVRIERALLERECACHLGRELPRPIEFDVGMDLSSPEGQSWSALVRYLLAELERKPNVFTSPLTRAHVEQLIVATLLLTQPHGYRDDLARSARPLAPAFVKRVEAYIDAHAEQPLTIGDLAAQACVSTSTLFAGFREFRGTSPMAYLRGVRLQRVRNELDGAECRSTTVTEVALRWGFSHLGRFAADYRRRFGESPSDTLKH